MNRYNTGFVLGKFCPLHRGHMLLIQRALDACDTVYIVVDNIMDEVIPVARRIEWVRRQYPTAVVLTQSHPLPQDPSETPFFWDIWREELLRLLPHPIDAVFASEQYGERLAKELSADFVMVDPDRLAVPISATLIRQDIVGQWHNLAPAAQNDLRKVICVYGPESTGKSTLTKQLAGHYHMPYVEEYAKQVIDAKNGDICFEDMEQIVRGHFSAVEVLAVSGRCPKTISAPFRYAGSSSGFSRKRSSYPCLFAAARICSRCSSVSSGTTTAIFPPMFPPRFTRTAGLDLFSRKRVPLHVLINLRI